MFWQLKYQKLDIFQFSRSFVGECYKLTKELPAEERYDLVNQIRRAALSVHSNIAEGASRKSNVERRRFYEVARGSVIEIDAALDVIEDMGYIKKREGGAVGLLLIKCFKILCGLIN
ncbi:MAG TPA: four helix bundle protein [Chitinophagaceae bacterium]|jgi:four helix bundle protein|nr:four helix bundle protein [Chitinophagaceae bacterium]